jgi:hypothetical protein
MSANHQRRETLHQIINGLQLRQEWLQLSQWESTRSVTAGMVWIGMGLQKQPSQAHSHPGTRQI